MNFVIFSRDFYPQRTAEAYCATRFASALAKAGHTVHVITVACPSETFEKAYTPLLHPAVRITYVPAQLKKGRWPHMSLRYLTILDADTVNLPNYIAATRKVLAQYEHPILVTRTQPMASLYVGWHCRKQAYRWVAHFSDPIPWGVPESRLEALAMSLRRHWIGCAFRRADLISVTCSRAFRFYREQQGAVVDRARKVVVTHIGDTKLDFGRSGGTPGAGGVPVVRHDGDMYMGRGLELLSAVEQLNREGFPCEFVQMRRVVEPAIISAFKSSPHCHAVDLSPAEEISSLSARSSVSFVADFNSSLPYSPLLMSKFVYQLFTDDPLVVLAKKDSEKHDYCERYPEAGLVFADQDDPAGLVVALKRAFEFDRSTIHRDRIRHRFSEETIADEFITAMKETL